MNKLVLDIIDFKYFIKFTLKMFLVLHDFF